MVKDRRFVACRISLGLYQAFFSSVSRHFPSMSSISKPKMLAIVGASSTMRACSITAPFSNAGPQAKKVVRWSRHGRPPCVPGEVL